MLQCTVLSQLSPFHYSANFTELSGHLADITFILDRRHHSSAVVTPVKYECDSIYQTGTFAKSEIFRTYLQYPPPQESATDIFSRTCKTLWSTIFILNHFLLVKSSQNCACCELLHHVWDFQFDPINWINLINRIWITLPRNGKVVGHLSRRWGLQSYGCGYLYKWWLGIWVIDWMAE